MSIRKLQKKNLALCIDAGEYEGVSLFTLKMYEYLPDPKSAAEGFLRVIDEEGDPYYYDAKAFVKVRSAQNELVISLPPAKRAKQKKQLEKNNLGGAL